VSDSIRPAGGDTATPLNLSKRIAYIVGAVGSLDGSRFIDCGCGRGEYVARLRDAGAHAVGIEIAADKLRDAAAGRAAACVARGDIQNLPFHSLSFDLALVNEVLEHVPDDLAGLREVHRVLRPDGRAVVFSPNRLYPFETHGVYWRGSARRVSHAAPGIPWLPLPLGRLVFRYWARNYWPWQLRGLARRAGFEIVHTAYVWQTFENISGRQPVWMRRVSGVLRRLAGVLEGLPLLRVFGVSQVLVLRRPVGS
jgi:SAM-dependent methyltransferase